MFVKTKKKCIFNDVFTFKMRLDGWFRKKDGRLNYGHNKNKNKT